MKHTFNDEPGKNAVRCDCGIYHYHCQICHRDCTIGTPASPATRDLQGVTRCRECQHTRDCQLMRYQNLGDEMLAALISIRADLYLSSIGDHRTIKAIQTAENIIGKVQA